MLVPVKCPGDLIGTPAEVECCFGLASPPIEGAQIVQSAGNLGMFWPQRLFRNCQAAPPQPFRMPVSFLIEVDDRKLIQGLSCRWVALAQRCFPDLQGTLKYASGFVKLTGGVMDDREVMQDCGIVRVLPPGTLF